MAHGSEHPAMATQSPGMTRSTSVPTMRRSSPQAKAMRTRIVSTMDLYPGIRDREAFIHERKQNKFKEFKENHKKYHEWLRDMKQRIQPSFKLPEDQYKGKKSADDEIMEKVDKAQRQMQDGDAAYKVWLEGLRQKQEERIAEQLEERKAELAAFEKDREERGAEVDKKRREEADERRAASGKYWKWLAGTKEMIDGRPSKIPDVKSMGPSVDEIVAKKRAALTKEMDEMHQEYHQWLASVSKPKFELPSMKVNSKAERDAIINAQAKKGIEKMDAQAAEYNKWVKEMQAQHQERIMEKVREKLRADREFDRKQEEAEALLEEKMAKAKEEADKVAADTKKAIKELQDRVKSRPLLIEQAYHYGRCVHGM
eukprot:TRINITY_DN39398_c0_g1_i1.p1 TRINITY_DN39398_c0_g1~~TRINITY_DN39398_c0_g1_i1.p1  ORF type:complete len:370 (+),score=104.61 TRINITY_DN39398_c0_g1_i1:74-1183(+)